MTTFLAHRTQPPELSRDIASLRRIHRKSPAGFTSRILIQVLRGRAHLRVRQIKVKAILQRNKDVVNIIIAPFGTTSWRRQDKTIVNRARRSSRNWPELLRREWPSGSSICSGPMRPRSLHLRFPDGEDDKRSRHSPVFARRFEEEACNDMQKEYGVMAGSTLQWNIVAKR